MNEVLNIEAIYREEHKRWLKEDAPRKSLRDRIAESVPYWIILVAIVLFLLSAPHTARVFGMLTPTLGWFAPIAVEFGLLYCSFQRRLAKAARTSVPSNTKTLEILFFVTAIVVNGTGAFVSVVSEAGIDDLSFADIGTKFGTLPATSQAALIMVVLAAFIIPIGALVAGEGLAAFVLEQKAGVDFREQRWQEVEHTVIYRAVFARYLQLGSTEREARQRAMSQVKGYLGSANPPSIRLLSAPSEQAGQPEHSTNGHNGSVKAKVRAFLDENPDIAQGSINQVHELLRGAGVEVGRTTVGEVLQERKQVQ
ncbi:MAG: hypothetical protein HY862_11910 [Chloroflexi bacterium]|nr:hypothetical protein [Chloroflexota bacterium]